jgi:UDP-N-acetylmuramoylalanine--D-glutamate ligase
MMKSPKGWIVILGAGESGIGAAALAKKEGFDVFVSDKGTIKDEHKAFLSAENIEFEEGQHSLEKIFAAEEVIKSPGIPDHIPIIRDLLAKDIPVISEIEFAARYTDAFIIGITGTNGKTTTTRLTYHLLHTAGKKVGMAGNVGRSFARDLAEGPEKELYVLELSSFQLDGIVDFRPNIAMILNISPDHLDRYEYKMENYIASKFRITENQQPGDYFLYQADDPNITNTLADKKLSAVPIAIDRALAGQEEVSLQGHTYSVRNPALKGPHNLMNASFAVKTAQLLGVAPDAMQKGLDTFVNVPHRLEWVRDFEGVSFYNDSKATNVEAVFYGLQAMDQTIIWIVGGQDKGNDYSSLMPLVREKVRVIVCMGVDNRKILEAFGPLGKPILDTRSAQEAVEVAFEQAQPGEVVLLSPACASFDLFKNYEDRGEQFKAAVQAL